MIQDSCRCQSHRNTIKDKRDTHIWLLQIYENLSEFRRQNGKGYLENCIKILIPRFSPSKGPVLVISVVSLEQYKEVKHTQFNFSHWIKSELILAQKSAVITYSFETKFIFSICLLLRSENTPIMEGFLISSYFVEITSIDHWRSS